MVSQGTAKKSQKIRETTGDRVFNTIIYIFITLIAFSMLYPIINVIAVSLADNRDYLSRPWMVFPKVFNFTGYQYIFKNSMFWRSYLNSIFVTAAGTLIGLALTALTAYPLSRK